MMLPSKERVAGVVLAGGQGRRMGGEPKVLMHLDGIRLVDHALRRAMPQVGALCLSSHLDAVRLGDPPCVVLRDRAPGFLGPLAGICSAMEHFRGSAPHVQWLCSFAADTPWFPLDLVERLLHALVQGGGADMAVACSAGRRHPVFALWPMSALPGLQATLAEGTDLSLGRFQSALRPATAEWVVDGVDPFFNLNTPEDLEHARALAAGGGDSAPRFQ